MSALDFLLVFVATTAAWVAILNLVELYRMSKLEQSPHRRWRLRCILFEHQWIYRTHRSATTGLPVPRSTFRLCVRCRARTPLESSLPSPPSSSHA